MPFKLTAILVVLGLLIGACASSNPATEPASPSPQATSPAATQPSEPSATSTQPGATTAITIATDTGSALKFDPPTVRVKAGTNVEVTFENRAAVPHDLTFDAPISMATSMIVAPGTSETIKFVAPAAGDYSFACTLHPSMGGTLTVEAG